MKKIRIAVLFMIGVFLLCSMPVSAAETPDYEFYGTPWDGTASESRDLTVYDSAVIRVDTELTDKHIRIEKGGVLEIADGANLSLNVSNIYIENGGTLIISDGTVTLFADKIPGSYISNYGTLILGANGRIDIKRGGLRVYPEGKFVNNGSVELVTKTGFTRSLSAIKKYNRDFCLSDYTMYAHSLDGKTAQITLFYRIGAIETSYKYTATYGTSSGVKLKRSNTALSEVYGRELRERLLDSVYAYEANNALPANFEEGKERSYSYQYSFARNTLTAEYLYFTIERDDDGEDGVVIDNTQTFTIDIV